MQYAGLFSRNTAATDYTLAKLQYSLVVVAAGNVALCCAEELCWLLQNLSVYVCTSRRPFGLLLQLLDALDASLAVMLHHLPACWPVQPDLKC